MLSDSNVTRSDVRRSLASTKTLLLRTLVEIGEDVGWRQFLRESNRIGTYGSACGLLAYCAVAPKDRSVPMRVAKTLCDHQREDGAWESPTIAVGVGLTTATCYAVLALRAAGFDPSAKELTQAAKWLKCVITDSGSVGQSINDSRASLICSALTIKALSSVNIQQYEPEVRAIINWLHVAQNSDGGFGETKNVQSSLHHTSEAIAALSTITIASSRDRQMLKSAAEYLRRNWVLGQNRHKDISYVSCHDREAMLPHSYQSDGLLLQAELGLAQYGLFHRTEEVVRWLVQQQQEGYWSHEAVPGMIPSWAIMECVVGLAQYLEFSEYTETPLKSAATHATPKTDGILVVATEWFSRHGGISTFNRELCTALAKIGRRVCCYVPSATQEEKKAAKTVGVQLLCVDSIDGREPTRDELYRPPDLPRGFGVEIIVGHGRITGPYAAAHVLDYFQSARRIHFVHMIADEIEWHKGNTDATELAELRMRCEKTLCEGATIVATVGPRIDRETRTLLHGLPDGPLVYRFNPGVGKQLNIDPSPAPSIQCLVLGRAKDVKLKGLDIAAKAFGMLPQLSPQLFASEPSLVVRGAPAGTGDQLRQDLLGVATKKVGIRIRQYSADEAHLAEDICRASVLLMPSRAEGFGLVALEAASVGIPVLVSNRSGFAELLVELLGPTESCNHVVEITGDLERDGSVWASMLETTLKDRTAAFARARTLRNILSSNLSWKLAVEGLLKECMERSLPKTPSGLRNTGQMDRL